MERIKDISQIVEKSVTAIKDADRVKQITQKVLDRTGIEQDGNNMNRLALQKVIQEKNAVILKHTIILKMNQVLAGVDNLADFGRSVGNAGVYETLSKIGDQVASIMEDQFNA